MQTIKKTYIKVSFNTCNVFRVEYITPMIIGIVNSKGGVGKSTISVHLTVWLHEQGVNVCLIDSDGQSSSTLWMAEAQPEVPCFQLRTSEEILLKIDELKKDFDVIVMDGPAGLNEATKTLMVICDGIMVPCGPSILDMRALNDSLQVVKQVQATREGELPVVRLVPNKLQRRYRLSKELLEAVEEVDVAGSTGLGLRSAYADAAGQGTVVWRMGRNARLAAEEMHKLFDEILNDKSTI